VPVSVVGVEGVQVVGSVSHKVPVHAGVPDTQAWALLVASAKQAEPLPQLPLQLWLEGLQLGQQLITWPQPSEAKPQLWPRSLQVFAVQLLCATPHVFGVALAPQNSSPVQVTPPLSALQVYKRPHVGSCTCPHLPGHTVLAGVGTQGGGAPQMLGSRAPQLSPCAQPPQSISPPQPSVCLPQLLPLTLPGQAAVWVAGTQATLPHWSGTPPPPQDSPPMLSQVCPPLVLSQVYVPPQPSV
jgi:hypothetical protein